jgi:hypothetical protein
MLFTLLHRDLFRWSPAVIVGFARFAAPHDDVLTCLEGTDELAFGALLTAVLFKLTVTGYLCKMFGRVPIFDIVEHEHVGKRFSFGYNFAISECAPALASDAMKLIRIAMRIGFSIVSSFVLV